MSFYYLIKASTFHPFHTIRARFKCIWDHTLVMNQGPLHIITFIITWMVLNIVQIWLICMLTINWYNYHTFVTHPSDCKVSKLTLPHTSLKMCHVLMPIQSSNWPITSCTSTYHKSMIDEKCKALLHRIETNFSVWLHWRVLRFELFTHRAHFITVDSHRGVLNMNSEGFNNPNFFQQ